MITRFLKGGANIERSNFIWNVIAGGINALEAVILLMVVTRTDGIEAAGVLTIAFALGNLLMTIGKFGVRSFQSTDVTHDFSFGNYLLLRILSCAAMLLTTINYAIVKVISHDYSLDKAVIVVGICLIYVIESFEDVYLGQYQLKGRLDIGSKVFILRWIAIILIFICCDLLIGLKYAVLIALVISLVWDIYLIKKGNAILKIAAAIDPEKLKALIIQCIPLFLAAFLTYYITNAPKYAIDQYMAQSAQAYFGYVSMPVFVVELLNCFLYQPHMVTMADSWQSGRLDELNRRIRKQLIIILGLTIACVIGAYFLGIPILQIIYGVKLEEYRMILVVLMTAGGMLAYVGYSTVLMTIMRAQKNLLINMIIVTVLALIGFGIIVQKWGLIGVSVYYLFLMFLLAIINFVSIAVIEKKKKPITEV